MPTSTAISNALQRNIDIINDSVRSYVDAGRALREILDKKQYLETHKTFDAFCKANWNFTERQARRLMQSSLVNDDLTGPIGPVQLKIAGKTTVIVPANEAQARAISEVSDDPRTRVQVWKGTVEIAPKDESGKPRITSKLIDKVAKTVKGTKQHKASKNGHAPVPEKPAPLPIPEAEAPATVERLSLPDFISEFNTSLDELDQLCPMDEFGTFASMLKKRAEKAENKSK